MEQKNPHLIDATLQVGKNGLTKEVINEINVQLKKRKIIKIKFLKSLFTSSQNSKEDIIKEIIGSTNARLVSKVGNVLVIKK